MVAKVGEEKGTAGTPGTAFPTGRRNLQKKEEKYIEKSEIFSKIMLDKSLKG